MAIVNLGSIKFNWKGAYAGGTAYAVDDVVSYNGSSYVCTAASTGNLPTNTNFWDQMSSAGTNGTDGTDLGTTLTTQGDIVYRDASGLARLGAGTAGQALLTQGAGANPSWGDVGGGKINQVLQTTSTTQQSFLSNTSFVDITNLSLAITPSATSSKIYVAVNLNYSLPTSDRGFQVKILRDSTAVFSETYNKATFTQTGVVNGRNFYDKLDSPSTTSQITYKVQVQTDSSGSVIFQDSSNPSNITLMEVLA